MFRLTFFFFLLIFPSLLYSQRLIPRTEALSLSLNNQRNVRAATLSVQQQEQLLRGAGDISNPQVFGEASPYEPLVLGVQQTFSLPGVYRNRKAVQSERIQLARLQLQGSQLDLKRDVSLSYLQLQYLSERERLLEYQDSIYQAIKISSKRFFDAGQINKLEELQATTQADAVRNELTRIRADLEGERELFRFYTLITDSFRVEPIQPYLFSFSADSITNVQQRILQQQVVLSERQVQAERSELLPQIQAGLLVPTTKEYERAVGYQVGITLPIWQRQNRSRVAAAQTGVEIAKATQELERLRLNAQYRQAQTNYQRELQSLNYFNTVALPQARSVIEVSQRLFQGGELNYIESLRNLQTAFEIFFNHIDTHRAFNESVIVLNYLNGSL